jgi:hypothetical protein
VVGEHLTDNMKSDNADCAALQPEASEQARRQHQAVDMGIARKSLAPTSFSRRTLASSSPHMRTEGAPIDGGTARAEGRAAPPSDVRIVCCVATCTSQRPAEVCKGLQPCGQHMLSPGSLSEFIVFVGHSSGAQKGGLLTGKAQR